MLESDLFNSCFTKNVCWVHKNPSMKENVMGSKQFWSWFTQTTPVSVGIVCWWLAFGSVVGFPFVRVANHQIWWVNVVYVWCRCAHEKLVREVLRSSHESSNNNTTVTVIHPIRSTLGMLAALWWFWARQSKNYVMGTWWRWRRNHLGKGLRHPKAAGDLDRSCNTAWR